MRRGQVSSLSIDSKIDRHSSRKEKLSTDPEEIFVEITLQVFTKVLQAHTYNTLHTWAAHAKSFSNERLNLN